MTAGRRGSSATRTGLFWIPCALFFVHFAEEARTYPEWATRHFGTTSMPFFLWSHVPLAILVVLVSWRATRARPGSLPVFLAFAMQWALATTGVFHVATALAFQEWAPGLASGTLLVFPLTAYLTRHTLREAWLTPRRAGAAITVGVTAMALLLATLWIDVRFP